MKGDQGKLSCYPRFEKIEGKTPLMVEIIRHIIFVMSRKMIP